MIIDWSHSEMATCVAIVDCLIRALRSAKSHGELAGHLESLAREMGFRYYALAHHDDLRTSPPDRVEIMDYPAAITDRLIHERRYRRDPIIRGCIFADGTFLWSQLHKIIALDRRDRATFAYGAREGLNEGITVPIHRLGECMGSCTFAGMRCPQRAERFIGPVEMIGTFAFQAARRLLQPLRPRFDSGPFLKPRPRDCVVLVGQGCSNKEIARLLGITPRTVDGYLTEAREIFEVHDRTELVISALLAGEIGLHELKRK